MVREQSTSFKHKRSMVNEKKIPSSYTPLKGYHMAIFDKVFRNEILKQIDLFYQLENTKPISIAEERINRIEENLEQKQKDDEFYEGLKL